MVRKLLTRPIHWYERRRPYPIKREIARIAPLTADLDSSTHLAVLTTSGMFEEAIWTVASALHFADIPLRATIFVDGVVSVSQELQNALGNVTVGSIQDWIDTLPGHLQGIRSFAAGHKLGKKFALLCALQLQTDVIYSDSDVLFFGACPELGSGGARFLQEEEALCGDPGMMQRLEGRGHRLGLPLNSGLLRIPKGAWDLSLIDATLAGADFSSMEWFAEQTMVAFAMERCGAIALPKDRYGLSNRRQFYFEQDFDYSKLALRHFTGPTRHVMYMRGMPLLAARWRRSGVMR